MKKLCLLAFAALSLTSCWTSIYTVAPTTEPVAPPKTVYTTTVTTPTPKTTTVTTITVTNYNTDLSFYLDLNAVAAAFAESRSVQEFEQILNSSRYMINNLDLNRDGWIDYLRVIETHRGYYHTLLIQACLGAGYFQDVATLIAERRADVLYVEVVGDRYLYGYNYVVRPIFVKRPPMWDVYGRPTYSPWSSPYYYGYWPSYYTKPKPIYLNHYQAYVNTYMTNHHYCHHCDYPSQPFYSGYTEMTKPHSHNEYAASHPSESFDKRVATYTATATGGVSVRNAGQLRQEVTRQQVKDTEAKKETTSTTTTATSGRTATGSSTTSSTSTRTSSSTTATSGSSTRSGSTSTSTSTSASTSTSGTSSRSTSTTTSSNKTTSSTKTQTQTQTATRQPSTTVESRVNKSGTTRTTVKTTDASGRTQTVKRESTSTRSTGSSTRSSSTSSSTSTRSSQGTSSESTPRSSQRGR